MAVFRAEHVCPDFRAEHECPVFRAEHECPVFRAEHECPVFRAERESPVFRAEHGEAMQREAILLCCLFKTQLFGWRHSAGLWQEWEARNGSYWCETERQEEETGKEAADLLGLTDL